MNNVYQEMLEREGLAKPGSDAKDDENQGQTRGKQMNNQMIQVPAGTDSVTLHLQKDSSRTACATLRQALLSTQGSRPVYVRVKERNGLKWEIYLGPLTADERDERDDALARAKRIERFSTCGLCDALVLLDERIVTKVDTREALVDIRGGCVETTAVVYEVAADAQ